MVKVSRKNILSENLDFWLHIDILCLHSCVTKSVVMDIISCLDVHNLIQKIIINAYFPKIDILTLVYKNGHNLACVQYFFLKLSPVCSTQTELSIHAKNSILMKNPKWSLFS